MEKEINQIRKSIAQRRKIRNVGSAGETKEQVTPIVPLDEEKHGYFPSFPEVIAGNKQKQSTTFFNDLIIKAILSIFLFLGATILLQSKYDFLAKPKQWTSNVLTEEFPFARVHQWYKETLGSPLAFSPAEKSLTVKTEPIALPVNGNITEGFQANGSGIMIAPASASEVTAWDSGIIIFSGNDRKTNKTIIIQHPNGSKSTYALLSSIDVHLYQAIEAGQRIGTFNPSADNETVYFSIEKNNEYIDPIKVIQVDVDEHK